MINSQETRSPFQHRWDFRSGSPRKLWRTLHDFLTDTGYEHEYEELKLEGTPIEGTATFNKTMDSHKDFEQSPRVWLWVIGFMLCITILLTPLGIRLMKASSRTLRTRIRIGIEGEVYRARGSDIQSNHAAELLGVVADVRLHIELSAGTPLDDTDREIVVMKNKKELKEFNVHFERLTRILDERILEIPLASIEKSDDDDTPQLTSGR